MRDDVAVRPGEEEVSEWREVELGGLCIRVTSGGTPKRARPDYYAEAGDGFAWIKSSELRDGYVRGSSEHISRLGLDESSAKLLPAGCVLVAMYGATAGRVGLLEIEAAVNQAVCALVLDPKAANSVFVFHALRNLYGELAANAAGAAQQNLNAEVIRRFRIVAPSVGTQERVAGFLSAFDELIEINERRIELLEDLTRSLYREWFVRFRFPGHEHVDLVASELGTIPQGWLVGALDGLCSMIQAGQTPKRSVAKNWDGGTIPWFKTGELRDGPLLDSDERVTEAANSRMFEPPAIFMAIYGSPTVGRLGWVTEPCSCNQASLALRTREPDTSQEWLWYQLLELRAQFNSMAQGAAQQNISKEKVASTRVALPPRELLVAFSAAVSPMREQWHVLAATNRRLASTRDLLLPRLVTGRLDISDLDLGELLPAEVA